MKPSRSSRPSRPIVLALAAASLAACGDDRPRESDVVGPAKGPAPAAAPASRTYVNHAARDQIGPHPRHEFVIAHDGFLAADEPKTVPASAASFLRDADEVYGIEIDGRARAYAVTKLAYHHVINDVMAGTPVLVTY